MSVSRMCFLLVLCLCAPCMCAVAQSVDLVPVADTNSGGAPSGPGVTTSTTGSASKEEVEQLRKKLAAQEETIQQLKAMVQQLVDAKGQSTSADARLQNASITTKPDAASASPAPTEAAPAFLRLPDGLFDPDEPGSQQLNLTPTKKEGATGPTAGWTGEHFFLRSPDGQFTLLPVGYLNASYTSYVGDGAPPNTFGVRRARFGVQGTYGANVDYAFLFDAANTASSGGIAVRDMYVNMKPVPAFQVQAGQFKEPFSQEVGTGDTNVEFLERSLVTTLYPSAAGTFRAPGLAVHGDVDGGVVQYWAGVFNGKGLIANNTTNELEDVGRLRFTPWKKHKGVIKGFSFGGSISHSRSRGLSNELSFAGTTNDSAFTWFPQFRINGGIARYNAEALLLTGKWGLRGEYTQILEKRDGVGSEAVGGVGFQTLPGIVGKGAYGSLTYLLTGEREPENAIPKVLHPVIGPPTPGVEGGSTPGMGAWQLKFRYSWIEGKAGGQNFTNQFTPESVPTFSAHTDQFSVGVNWYLNYWILMKFDINMDRLHDPSVGGVLPQNYFVAVQGLQFRF